MAAFDHSRDVAHQLGLGDTASDASPDDALAAFYGQWPTTLPWDAIRKRPPTMTGWTLYNGDGCQ